MTLFPMTRQEVPPLLTPSGVVLKAQRDRVGHITSSDSCRRPVGREKKKKPQCLIFGTRTIAVKSETGNSSQGVLAHVRDAILAKPVCAPACPAGVRGLSLTGWSKPMWVCSFCLPGHSTERKDLIGREQPNQCNVASKL